MGNYLEGYGKDNCGHCGLNRTTEGHDGCIGTLENVMNACCGHGEVMMAYIQFDHEDYRKEPNKFRLSGEVALRYIKAKKLSRFHATFPHERTVYLEDSVLWYCLDMGIDWYLGLTIHERINFKQSYF